MATRESTDQGVAQPGFIFTTALPPAICAAATVAIRHSRHHNGNVTSTKDVPPG
jgi:7-keto-8-aminopelargonate synthetase-like enzyme